MNGDGDGGGDNPWTSRLGLLALTHVAGTVSIVSVLAMAPVITRDMGLNAAEFGFFITAYYGAQALCSMPAGALVDRIGVGRALVVCHAIMVLGALMLSQAADFPLALAALATMGVGYSISNPATARGVFEWFPSQRRATAMGIKQVGVPLGGILGAANGALVTLVPWGPIMLGIAGLVLVNGLLCLRLARLPSPAPPSPGRHPLANILEITRDGNLNRFAIINGLYNFGQTNFFAFLTLFMRDVALASQPVASLCIGIAQAASAFARVGWGVVSDTLFCGRRKGLTVALGMVSAAGLGAMALVGPGSGVTLGLGYNRRLHPAMTDLRQRITSGGLGTILHIEATMTFPQRPVPETRSVAREKGRNAVRRADPHGRPRHRRDDRSVRRNR